MKYHQLIALISGVAAGLVRAEPANPNREFRNPSPAGKSGHNRATNKRQAVKARNVMRNRLAHRG